ncbi:MAG: hypothetical protein A3C35_01795 [Omnitrophica bacterium RIFCSPHIGHO2_02_FULL_46_11]|nr:MAG: hypothetical protein A3A81_03575 [Omnitrophica bacterium RIFCSPLOWO2_01_FULL_45_10b]OGW87094.1 MAG: hypothetical protein A3C35_01795 [Omnitrophica bacterium RIFCSPHIGHO2_02_FULL_46_11]
MICAGHTGGHFFPTISCAEAFRISHPEVEVHILMNRMPEFAQEVARAGLFRIHLIPFSAFPPFFSLKLFGFLLEYSRAFWRTFHLLLNIKPQLVLGFGSYGSVPGVFCAAIFRIPILLHEQNALAGWANRFLATFAARVAVSFPETKGWFLKPKLIWTGYPLRPEFEGEIKSSQYRGDEGKRFTLLVFGGSQGSKRLNQIFLESLSAFSAEERAHFAVIHIVGNSDLNQWRQSYQNLGIVAEVNPFSSQIFEQYRRADLVIARAGAGTVFELAALGRAAILIPYPYAYAHQEANGAYLARQGAAQMICEKDLTAQKMKEAIAQLYANASERHQLEHNIKRLSKREAGHELVEIGWELICKKN